jgi:hypothetical protein
MLPVDAVNPVEFGEEAISTRAVEFLDFLWEIPAPPTFFEDKRLDVAVFFCLLSFGKEILRVNIELMRVDAHRSMFGYIGRIDKIGFCRLSTSILH